MGQSAIGDRSARLRTRHDTRRRKTSELESAVELRLGEKRAGKLEDLIGFAQLTHLTLQFFDALLIRRGGAFSLAGVPLVLANPSEQGLRPTVDRAGSSIHQTRGDSRRTLSLHTKGHFSGIFAATLPN